MALPYPALNAQSSPTGTLTGTIVDSSGAMLPGVTVTAKNEQTGLLQTTMSGGEGDWRIPALPTGTYEVSFELDGFKRISRSGVLVGAAGVHTIPATLEVGSVTEVVEVRADAALLAVTTAVTARSLTSAELEAVLAYQKRDRRYGGIKPVADIVISR